jgi:hypothetical protein
VGHAGSQTAEERKMLGALGFTFQPLPGCVANFAQEVVKG